MLSISKGEMTVGTMGAAGGEENEVVVIAVLCGRYVGLERDARCRGHAVWNEFWVREASSGNCSHAPRRSTEVYGGGDPVSAVPDQDQSSGPVLRYATFLT